MGTESKQLGIVTAERDALRLELELHQAHETDGWWAPSSTQPRPRHPASYSSQSASAGALTRQVHSLKEQVQMVVKDKWTEVQKERDIARSLRARIDELEQCNSKSRLKSHELEEELKAVRKELEEERGIKGSQEDSLAGQLADARESLLREKKLSARLENTIAELKRAKGDVEAELAARSEHCPLVAHASPAASRILQVQQPNVTPHRVKEPTTPQKRKAAAPANPLASSTTWSPTTALADRFVYLEERHNLLRQEYEKLRAKYHDDLKHWKEYKAMEVARIQLKKQRKAEKRATKAKTRQTVSAVDPRTPNDNEVLIQRHQRAVSKDGRDAPRRAEYKENNPLENDELVKQEPVEDTDFELVAASDNSQSLSQNHKTNEPQRQERTVSPSMTITEEWPNDAKPKTAQPRPLEPLQVQPAISTPRVPENRRLGPTTSRTTPWLGGDTLAKPGTPTTTKRARAIQGEEADLAIKTATPKSTLDTPLARDRGIAPDTMHKAALQRNMSRGMDTPGASPSARKRKEVDETAEMTPEQRVQHLRKLNKMSAAEKRAYYAQYKGQGRYLPPDQVRAGVFDEFEIDPKQNEGAKFQFHDVKRQKAERKHMHGGDCECCKDYYEAVGHIPRFNAAPKWKDDSQPDGEDKPSEEALRQEHLNRVSRHRETWKRAPTPPGYWNIGFPNTQDVAEQNAEADEMVQRREEQVRRDAVHKDSKWRHKA